MRKRLTDPTGAVQWAEPRHLRPWCYEHSQDWHKVMRFCSGFMSHFWKLFPDHPAPQGNPLKADSMWARACVFASPLPSTPPARGTCVLLPPILSFCSSLLCSLYQCCAKNLTTQPQTGRAFSSGGNQKMSLLSSAGVIMSWRYDGSPCASLPLGTFCLPCPAEQGLFICQELLTWPENEFKMQRRMKHHRTGAHENLEEWRGWGQSSWTADVHNSRNQAKKEKMRLI